MGVNSPTGAGVGSEPGTGAPPAWKAPDFLPEHLRGEDVAKTFDKVVGDWKGLRDKVAALPAPPKSVDDYAFEPSEKVKPFVGDLRADPAFALMREAALKAGIPASQFSAVVGGFYEGLVEKGMAPAPYNADAERSALLGQQAVAMSEQQRIDAAASVINPLAEQIEGLARTNAFDADPKVNKAAMTAVIGLLDTAVGVRAVQGLLKLAKAAPGLQPGGAPAAGSVSAADLRKRMGDPRNDPGSFAYEPAFREATLAAYQQYYR